MEVCEHVSPPPQHLLSPTGLQFMIIQGHKIYTGNVVKMMETAEAPVLHLALIAKQSFSPERTSAKNFLNGHPLRTDQT